MRAHRRSIANLLPVDYRPVVTGRTPLQKALTEEEQQERILVGKRLFYIRTGVGLSRYELAKKAQLDLLTVIAAEEGSKIARFASLTAAC